MGQGKASVYTPPFVYVCMCSCACAVVYMHTEVEVEVLCVPALLCIFLLGQDLSLNPELIDSVRLAGQQIARGSSCLIPQIWGYRPSCLHMWVLGI